MCGDCQDDRWDHGDISHKSIILNRIISGDWSSRTHVYGDLAQMQINRAGFKWFCERPGA